MLSALLFCSILVLEPFSGFAAAAAEGLRSANRIIVSTAGAFKDETGSRAALTVARPGAMLRSLPVSDHA